MQEIRKLQREREIIEAELDLERAKREKAELDDTDSPVDADDPYVVAYNKEFGAAFPDIAEQNVSEESIRTRADQLIALYHHQHGGKDNLTADQVAEVAKMRTFTEQFIEDCKR